jgi:DNA-binding PadR family transcriptional regulator
MARKFGANMTKNENADMCDMRGMLSFMVLWLLSNRPMCGQALATEIEKRRGEKPNPGTIYPALKELANRGLIKAHSEGRTMVYELTEPGRATLSKSLEYFERAFSDIFYSTATVRQRR